MIVTNGKIYEQCSLCRKLVRVNKPLLGSQHFCVSKEDRERISHAEHLNHLQQSYEFMRSPDFPSLDPGIQEACFEAAVAHEKAIASR